MEHTSISDAAESTVSPAPTTSAAQLLEEALDQLQTFWPSDNSSYAPLSHETRARLVNHDDYLWHVRALRHARLENDVAAPRLDLTITSPMPGRDAS